MSMSRVHQNCYHLGKQILPAELSSFVPEAGPFWTESCNLCTGPVFLPLLHSERLNEPPFLLETRHASILAKFFSTSLLLMR